MALPLDVDAIAVLSLEGAPVVSGALSGMGIFVENQQVEGSDGGRGEVLLVAPTVVVSTQIFGSLRIDDPISVDGRDYKIRLRTTSDDPALVKFALREDR